MTLSSRVGFCLRLMQPSFPFDQLPPVDFSRRARPVIDLPRLGMSNSFRKNTHNALKRAITAMDT